MPFFWFENRRTVSSWCFIFNVLFSLKLGELIPIPDDSPPPPALSSNVSRFPALPLTPSLTSTCWIPSASSIKLSRLWTASSAWFTIWQKPQNYQVPTERSHNSWRGSWTQTLETCHSHVVAESSWAREFPSLGLSLLIDQGFLFAVTSQSNNKPWKQPINHAALVAGWWRQPWHLESSREETKEEMSVGEQEFTTEKEKKRTLPGGRMDVGFCNA